jgi:hypothetical protein
MKAVRGLLSTTVLALIAACNTGEPQGPTPAPTSGGDVTDSGGHVAQCHPTCSTAADCAVPGSPLESASHFACTGGTCVWQGCQSDSECNASAPMGAPHLVCRTGPGAPMPSCVPSCTTAADCAESGSALTAASHWACTSGVCEWQGCQSTSECASALHVSNVVCEKPAGAPAKTCEPTCNTAADCAQSGQPLEDASHFACKAHRCQWLGCASTSDCTSGFHSSHFVCE